MNATTPDGCEYKVTLNGEVCRVVEVTNSQITAANTEWIDHLKDELFQAHKSSKRKRWESPQAYAKRMRKRGYR